ncbi:MAG: thiamine diphosphokinase [Balneolales bacterium]
MGKYSAFILCDGEPPTESLFHTYNNLCDVCIATDGAALTALRYGITPDVVIGDMDSFVPPAGYLGNIITDPDQNSNDLEKALAYAVKKGIEDAVVLGATGKRLDHTLKNLSVYRQFKPRFKKLIFEDDYVKIILLPRVYAGQVETSKTTISLFPLSGKVTGVTTTGLKYGLNNEDLINGVRDGSSNETTGTHFEIKHSSGDLLLFQPQRHKGSKFLEKESNT